MNDRPATGPRSIVCDWDGCELTSADTPIFRVNPKGERPFIGMCAVHRSKMMAGLEP